MSMNSLSMIVNVVRPQEIRLEQDMCRITPIPITITGAHIDQFIKDHIGKHVKWIGLNRHGMKFMDGFSKGGPSVFGRSHANIRFQCEADMRNFSDVLETKLNNYMFNIRVALYKTPAGQYEQRSLQSTMEGETHWMQITNLSRNCNEEDIYSVIQSRGKLKKKILGVHLKHHPKWTNYPSKCDIECASAECATLLVENLRMKQVKGVSMWTDWLRAPNCVTRRYHEQNAQTKRVRFFGLHSEVQSQQIKKLCKPFGKVKEAVHEMALDDYPSGHGFVVMNTEKEARAVHQGLHGKMVKDLKLYTYFAQGSIKKFQRKVYGKKPAQAKKFKKKPMSRKVLRTKSKGERKRLIAQRKRGKTSKNSNNFQRAEKKKFKKWLKQDVQKKMNFEKTYGQGKIMKTGHKKFGMKIKMKHEQNGNGPKRA